MYNSGVCGELALGEFDRIFVPDRRVTCYEDRDRHVRRYGEDYTYAFLALLPQGQAWPRLIDCTNDESVLYKVHRGLAWYWEFVDGRAADLLTRESDPRITLELLPDWERNWGLPDPCWSQAQTIGERQRELVMWMTMLGGSSRDFFKGVAARLGYTIGIQEYRPFQVGIDRCGDNRLYGTGAEPMFDQRWWWPYAPVLAPDGEYVKEGELSEWPNYGLGPPSNRFYWKVHAGETSLIWFRCGNGGGECGVDPHLKINRFEDLECILERWAQAQTKLIYDYSGTTPNNPMAGTP